MPPSVPTDNQLSWKHTSYSGDFKDKGGTNKAVDDTPSRIVWSSPVGPATSPYRSSAGYLPLSCPCLDR